MQTIESITPLAAVLVAMAGPVLIILFRKNPNIRELMTFIISFAAFGLVISMAPAIVNGYEISFQLIEILPGAGIGFKVDSFGFLFAVVSSSLWIVTSVYSIGYMRALKEHSQTRFFSFFSIAISSALGVAFSANLLTLYMFYEILSLSTYSLVTHNQNKESRFGGRKYLTYLMGSSIAFFLPAVIITYYYTGTLDFESTGILILNSAIPDAVVIAMFLLFLFGIGKAAVMPMHSWLPSAMVAPTPVSSLLHAVAVVKVGVFSMLRVMLFIFGTDVLKSLSLDTFLIYFVSVTIIAGSLLALKQDNLKARLAYSTVSQLSYIILAGGLLSVSGISGGILHIAMHAFGKITLFFCAGAILVNTGFKNISELKGLGKKMPVTFLAFFFGSLSIIGIPPFGGFWSKWNLAMGSIESGHLPIIIVLLTSSLLNAAYFLPITYNAFFTKENSQLKFEIKEAPLLTVIPPVFTALVSFTLFIYPDFFLNLARNTANMILGVI